MCRTLTVKKNKKATQLNLIQWKKLKGFNLKVTKRNETKHHKSDIFGKRGGKGVKKRGDKFGIIRILRTRRFWYMIICFICIVVTKHN